MVNIAEWFIRGEFDWEQWGDISRKWSSVVAGLLFGIGWSVWADGLIQETISSDSKPPFKYWWPGIIATISLILLNLISRAELAEISSSGDGGDETRARLWLLVSFLFAAASVIASVSILVSTNQSKTFVATGIGSVVQCGFILASALLFWSIRSTDEENAYGFI